MLLIEWAELKSILDQNLNTTFFMQESSNDYKLFSSFGGKDLLCILPKSEENYAAPISDFESTYKSKANKQQHESASPYSAKSIGSKKIYSRDPGFQQAVLVGENVFYYEVTYPWVKITALEVIGADALDTVTLQIQDTEVGAYSGIPNKILNQFSETLNVAAGFYRKQKSFDADLYLGLKIKFIYNSLSAKTIGVNIDMDEVR